jgi:hypothetical protein
MRRLFHSLCRACAPAIVALGAGLGGGVAHAHGLEPWMDNIIQEMSIKYDVWYWKLEYAVHCESGHYNMDVITGRRRGALGEIGAVQLLPGRGLLPDFYARGFDDPRSFGQSVEYLALMVSENARNRFYWSCWPRFNTPPG